MILSIIPNQFSHRHYRHIIYICPLVFFFSQRKKIVGEMGRGGRENKKIIFINNNSK